MSRVHLRWDSECRLRIDFIAETGRPMRRVEAERMVRTRHEGVSVTWVLIGFVVALVIAKLLVARYEYRQVRRRTQQHLAAGGRIREAPDMMPGHGGGSAGG